MRRLAVLFLAMSLVLIGCSDAPAELETKELPSWIERVYPAPGASTTGGRQVEVGHNLPEAPDERIRLLIDGVDVTTYARFQGTTLVYDPAEGPVPLQAERHTATVQWVRLPAAGSDEVVVLDEFTWTFSMN